MYVCDRAIFSSPPAAIPHRARGERTKREHRLGEQNVNIPCVNMSHPAMRFFVDQRADLLQPISPPNAPVLE